MSELMSITKEIFYPHFLCLVRQLNEHDPWEYLTPVNFLNEIYEGCPEEIITFIKEKFPIFFDFLIKPTVELSDPPVDRRNYKNDDDVNTSLTNDSHVLNKKKVSGKKNVFESITFSREVPGKRKVFVKNDKKMAKRECKDKGIASGVRVMTANNDYRVTTADNEDDHAKKVSHYIISNSQTKFFCPESKDKTGKKSMREIISPKRVEAGKRSDNMQFPQNDNMNTMTLEVLKAQQQWLNQISEEELEILRRKFRQQVHFSEDIWSPAFDLASIAMDSYDNDGDIECNESYVINVDPNIEDYDMIRVDDIVENDEIDGRVDDKMSDENNDTNSIGLSDELDDDVNNNILDNVNMLDSVEGVPINFCEMNDMTDYFNNDYDTNNDGILDVLDDDVNNNILDNAYTVDSVEGVQINFYELDSMADNFVNDDNDCFSVIPAPEFSAKPLENANSSLCILDNKDSDLNTSDFGGYVIKVIVGELAKDNGSMIKEIKKVKLGMKMKSNMKLSAKKYKMVKMRMMKLKWWSDSKKLIKKRLKRKMGMKIKRKMKLSAKKNKMVKMRMMKFKGWTDSKRLIIKRLKRKRLKTKVGCLRKEDQCNKIKQKVKMRMMESKGWTDSKRLIKKRLKRKRIKTKVGCLRKEDQCIKIKQIIQFLMDLKNNYQITISHGTKQLCFPYQSLPPHDKIIDLAKSNFPYVGNHTIYYVDDKGDEVSIQSEVELTEAYRLAEHQGKCDVRLHLQREPASKELTLVEHQGKCDVRLHLQREPALKELTLVEHQGKCDVWLHLQQELASKELTETNNSVNPSQPELVHSIPPMQPELSSSFQQLVPDYGCSLVLDFRTTGESEILVKIEIKLTEFILVVSHLAIPKEELTIKMKYISEFENEISTLSIEKNQVFQNRKETQHQKRNLDMELCSQKHKNNELTEQIFQMLESSILQLNDHEEIVYKFSTIREMFQEAINLKTITIAAQDSSMAMLRDTLTKMGKELRKDKELMSELVSKMDLLSCELVSGEYLEMSRHSLDVQALIESLTKKATSLECQLVYEHLERETLDQSLVHYLLQASISGGKIPFSEESRDQSETAKKKIVVIMGCEVLYKPKPLWLWNHIELSKEVFNTVYKSLSNVWEEHLDEKHFFVEGQPDFCAFLFFPKCAPFDMFNNRKKPNNIKLYDRCVFIMDNCEELVPEWLYILKCLVGSKDLPLNILCVSLQQYKILWVIYLNNGKMVMELFIGITEIREVYVTFYMNQKYVIHIICTNRKKLVEFLHFFSTKSGSVMTFLMDYYPRKKGLIFICYVFAANYVVLFGMLRWCLDLVFLRLYLFSHVMGLLSGG